MDMSLSKLQELVMDREACHSAVHVHKESDMTEQLNWTEIIQILNLINNKLCGYKWFWFLIEMCIWCIMIHSIHSFLQGVRLGLKEVGRNSMYQRATFWLLWVYKNNLRVQWLILTEWLGCHLLIYFKLFKCFTESLLSGKTRVCVLSHVQLFPTPWTVAHQALLSMGSFRQEYWSGLPFPTPIIATADLN